MQPRRNATRLSKLRLRTTKQSKRKTSPSKPRPPQLMNPAPLYKPAAHNPAHIQALYRRGCRVSSYTATSVPIPLQFGTGLASFEQDRNADTIWYQPSLITHIQPPHHHPYLFYFSSESPGFCVLYHYRNGLHTVGIYLKVHSCRIIWSMSKMNTHLLPGFRETSMLRNA